MLRWSALAPFLVIALLLGSGAAIAKVDSQEPDTRFNFAYDPINYLIVFHSTPLDNGTCGSLAGPVSADYGGLVDGFAQVVSLSNGYDLTLCPLGAWLATGPRGQVNHGQVVRTFGHALENGRKGCLMRWIAQSDFGKADQQVRTPDADPDFVPGTTGDLEFTSQDVACHNGNASSNGHLRGEARGNSENAPGHNK